MESTKFVLAMLLGGACAFVPNIASATESLKRVGVQAGFAGVAAEGSFAGFGGALSAGYGLTDAWTLTAWTSVSSNQVRPRAETGRSVVLSQAVGINYALDILQLVPFVGAAIAGYEFVDERGTQGKVGVQLVFGLDYMLSRNFALGIELRGHALPIDVVNAPNNPTTFYATSFLKGEYVWGWF